MKKKNIYIISLVVFVLAVTGIVYNYNRKEQQKENQTYPLLARKAQADDEEWKKTQQNATDLMAAVKADATDVKSALKLAALYIQEARETGNHQYYDPAAMKQVNNVLSIDASNFNALVFKSLIYLSQHHFAEGLATARQAQQINPSNAYVYGLMVDGHVEMGSYDSAVLYADKMVSIRPDLTSYSRISYLREIFGDYPGAINAMKMAVEAGGKGDEHTEWTRVQLGSLYEKTADYKAAQDIYGVALSVRPDYAYALAGMARLSLASGDYRKAISYYEKADSLITDNSIKEELVDAYKAAGETRKAEAVCNEVIEALLKDSKPETDDETVGHYSDRELAYAYLKVNQPKKALEHAMLEYNRRPENIDVNETVAWVLYNMGEYSKAAPYIDAALKTNSKNPVLLSRAGLIYYKSGDMQKARPILQQASASNAYVERNLKTETSTAMQRM